jgi:hypothetical protein
MLCEFETPLPSMPRLASQPRPLHATRIGRLNLPLTQA